MSRSSICNFFSEEIPRPPGAWKKKWMFKTRQKLVKKKTSDAFFRNTFLFWTYEKKTLTHQPINRLNNQKMLQQHLSGKNNKKFRSSTLIFFLYVQNKKTFRKKHLRFFSSLTFVFFWTFTFFFIPQEVGGSVFLLFANKLKWFQIQKFDSSPKKFFFRWEGGVMGGNL